MSIGFCLSRPEREQGNLRRTKESERNSHRPNSAIDVELQVSQAKLPFNVLFSQIRELQSTEEWQSNLASMRVAGQHPIDSTARGLFEQSVDVVRGMTHQYDGLVRQIPDRIGDGRLRVRIALHWIIQPRKPKPAAGALDWQTCVMQHGDAVGLESLNDLCPTNNNVMVAKYCKNALAIETLENIRALPARINRVLYRGNSGTHIVAREKNQVGLQLIDAIDHVAEEERLRVLVHVDVTELRDAHSIEDPGQACEGDLNLDDLKPMALNLTGINRQSGSTPCGSLEKPPPTDWLFGDGIEQSHVQSYPVSTA